MDYKHGFCTFNGVKLVVDHEPRTGKLQIQNRGVRRFRRVLRIRKTSCTFFYVTPVSEEKLNEKDVSHFSSEDEDVKSITREFSDVFQSERPPGLP